MYLCTINAELVGRCNVVFSAKANKFGRLFFGVLVILFSEEKICCLDLNLMIATRSSKISAYDEMKRGEVCLVFAQLASCIPSNDRKTIEGVLIEALPADSFKGEILEIFQKQFVEPALIDPTKPIVILFNEMFLGEIRL